MNGVGLIGAIIVGILAGLIAEKVMKRKHGFPANLLVGLAGALLGGFGADLLNVHFAGLFSSLIVSSLGAITFLYLLDVIRR
jgi:uncharacterized membrane protein YeaQ/YmgE (transglycosylase-associated protein family)